MEKRITDCSWATKVMSVCVGLPFIAVGVISGCTYGWHAQAICLITAGGLCFAGYPAGLAIVERIKAHLREEDARIKAATDLYRNQDL